MFGICINLGHDIHIIYFEFCCDEWITLAARQIIKSKILKSILFRFDITNKITYL